MSRFPFPRSLHPGVGLKPFCTWETQITPKVVVQGLVVGLDLTALLAGYLGRHKSKLSTLHVIVAFPQHCGPTMREDVVLLPSRIAYASHAEAELLCPFKSPSVYR